MAAGFVLLVLLGGKLVRPRGNKEATVDTYECGEAPVGQAWFNFNPRFYIITLIFIVFDVEIAFIYPVAMVFKRWVSAGHGLIAAVEIFVFVAILMVALVYVFRKGDLEWLRALKSVREDPFLEPVSAVRTVETREPIAEDAV